MTKRALLVGIDNYVDFIPLNGCEADAASMADILGMQEYGFTTTLLAGQAATGAAIKTEIERLFRPEVDALYLFYFSGHGVRTNFGASICASDGSRACPGVEFSFLEQVSRTLRDNFASFVIILDCCHSGEVSLPVRGLSPESILSHLTSAGSSSVVLAACGEAETAKGLLGRGVFTNVLLEAISGCAANNNGEVTALSVSAYLEQQFRATERQHPVIRADVSRPVVLGEGITPQYNLPEPNESLDTVVEEARRKLDSYLKDYSSFRPMLDVWKERGYRTCSATLHDLLEWFERKDRQHRLQMKVHPTGSIVWRELKNQIAALGPLSDGTKVQFGAVARRLGSGTFGTVFLVERESERLAYKQYHHSDLSVDEKVRRFRQGHDAMTKLDHPHIVRVFGFTQAPIGFYMQYIEGMNLRDAVDSLKDPRNIMHVLLLVAETLRHAHGRTVIHRDVKPENIVLQWDAQSMLWQPYLMDFDLAWYSTATQLTKEGIGTLQYAAPEQLQAPGSNKAHSPQVDSFSLGQLLYFAINGADPTPFDPSGNRLVIERKLTNATGWSFAAASATLALYAACTVREPEKRPTMAQICEGIAGILPLLVTQNAKVSSDEMIQELLFFVGGKLFNGNSVTSIAGKVHVSVSVSTHVNTSATFLVNCEMSGDIQLANDFQTSRRILHSRVVEALKGKTARLVRRDMSGNYSVEVEQAVTLDRAGLRELHQATASIIDAMERA